ncbi:2'-5' RNA ligase family protein [Streptomyces sp. NPDC059524]|uniref:2'-5' RNA ligase family protein n=1 Tax=Streptomyces sp. NPDC059524 TaxID=3346856 RepID=UPI0036B84795
MEDFFARVEHHWPAGRKDLHWHILHEPSLAHEQLVAPYRHVADQPGIAPVDARWLHTTLMHGGPVDEYKPDEIDQIVDLVRTECAAISPFTLVYDRPAVGVVALESAARPAHDARRLWELTTRIDRQVTGGRFETRPASFYPHTSLAYGITGPDRPDRHGMKVLLSDVDAGPVPMRVIRISLVAQSHDRRHITWDHIADVPLGTAL